MADPYREKVTQLLKACSTRKAAHKPLKRSVGSVDAIVLTPDGETLRIELQGNRAAMLKAAEARKTGAPLPPLFHRNADSCAQAMP